MFSDILFSGLQQAVGGTLHGADAEVLAVSTDTRTIHAGDTFVALSGPNFRGEDFLATAGASGARAAIVSSFVPAVNMSQLVVEDTQNALTQLAEINRSRFQNPVVAMTGSCGKTTVKELVAHLLGGESVLYTQGNLNNHIGVPLTLCRLNESHSFAVIELGASGIGEIASTARITKPDVAIITNAGAAHIEGFGSYSNVVLAKGEIIDALGPNGKVILNKDDPAFDTWAERAGSREVLSFSARGDQSATLWADGLNSEELGTQFTVYDGDNVYRASMPLAGEHNVANALASILAVSQLGIDIPEGIARLASAKAAKGRMELFELAANLIVIDDSYNANPVSMKAACDVLVRRQGLSVLVVGDMAELGAESEQMHRDIGEYARNSGVDSLLCVGSNASAYVQGYGVGAIAFPDKKALLLHLQAQLQNHCKTTGTPMTILVKGSRSSSMDTIVNNLKEMGASLEC